jgi:REP element-mobilizing transposase RayT
VAPPRIEVIGAVYHVNGKAVQGTKLFVDDVDRASFLRLLEREARHSGWRVFVYSLMSTHYHVLFRLEKPALSSGFQRLNGDYAKAYNRRHERRGALWQRRFYDSIVDTDGYLLEAVRYIALNAPRANMCRCAEDWPWCSYGSSVGAFPRDSLVDHDELLRLFATRRDVAMRRLRAFVEEGDPRERRRQTPV